MSGATGRIVAGTLPRLLDPVAGHRYDQDMLLSLGLIPLLQASVIRDTIVTLTMPAQRTAFDYASGTLQILVLVVGLVALAAMALLALTLRKAVVSLQGTVDRLSADAKPLISQATRVTEEARDVMKRVRGEVDHIADATASVSARLHDLSDAAEARIDEVNALLDVLQDEVQDTALSAAAAVRGARVGAVALGAALGLRTRRLKPDADHEADGAYLDDGDDDDAEDELDDRSFDELPPDERPYLEDVDDALDDELERLADESEDEDESDADVRDDRPRTSSKRRQ